MLEAEAEEAKKGAEAVEIFQAASPDGALYEGTDRVMAVNIARAYFHKTRENTAVYSNGAGTPLGIHEIWNSKMHGGIRRPRRPS